MSGKTLTLALIAAAACNAAAACTTATTGSPATRYEALTVDQQKDQQRTTLMEINSQIDDAAFDAWLVAKHADGSADPAHAAYIGAVRALRGEFDGDETIPE